MDEASPRPGAGGESSADPTVWEISQKFSDNMGDFDFDLFFRSFGLDSRICRSLENFPSERFPALLEAASVPVEKVMTSSNVKFVAVHRACLSLKKALEKLHNIFTTIGQAGLQVSSILENMEWMQQVNQRKIDEMIQTIREYAVKKIEDDNDPESELPSFVFHDDLEDDNDLEESPYSFVPDHARAPQLHNFYGSSVRIANNSGRTLLPPSPASWPTASTAPPTIPGLLPPFWRPHHDAPVPNSYDAGSYPRRLRSRHSITYLPAPEQVHRLPYLPHPPHPPFSDNSRRSNAPRPGHEQVQPPPPYYGSSVRIANNSGRSLLPPSPASWPTAPRAPPTIPVPLPPFRRPHDDAPVPNSGQLEYDAGSYSRRVRSRNSNAPRPDHEQVHRLPNPPHPPHPPFAGNSRHSNAHEQVQPPPPYQRFPNPYYRVDDNRRAGRG